MTMETLDKDKLPQNWRAPLIKVVSNHVWQVCDRVDLTDPGNHPNGDGSGKSPAYGAYAGAPRVRRESAQGKASAFNRSGLGGIRGGCRLRGKLLGDRGVAEHATGTHPSTYAHALASQRLSLHRLTTPCITHLPPSLPPAWSTGPVEQLLNNAFEGALKNWEIGEGLEAGARGRGGG